MTWPPAKPKLRLVKPGRRRKNAQPEADLQSVMVRWLDLALPDGCGIFWSATLNGVKVTPAIRAKLKAQGLRRGVLDLVFIIMRDMGGLRAGDTFWIEVKTSTGRPTPEQEALMDVLYPAGRGAYARSVEQLCAALTAFGFPLRCRV